MKIGIGLFAALLALSALSLAARYGGRLYTASTHSMITVPANLIDENTQTVIADKPEAVKLELYRAKPGDNERFEIRDMLPGDSETRYFCVKAYHEEAVTLVFRARITEQTKALGDALHIRVTRLESGEVLCDAPFSALADKEYPLRLAADTSGESLAYYTIDVSMDTSAGNAYQAARLRADLSWYVQDEGGLTPPPTGDAGTLALWSALALSSLLLILLLRKRRKGDESRG